MKGTDAQGARPERPRTVHAFVVIETVALVRFLADELMAGIPSWWIVSWAMLLSAAAMTLLWHASRAGWVFVTVWTVISAPYVLVNFQDGVRGVIDAVIFAAVLTILLSPSMVRWIWRRKVRA